MSDDPNRLPNITDKDQPAEGGDMPNAGPGADRAESHPSTSADTPDPSETPDTA